MVKTISSKRILIIGTAGSGKSTLARSLSNFFQINEIELDEINWLPNWENRQTSDKEGFIKDVALKISTESWVATGGYLSVRDLLWSRANIIIWLDLPYLTVLKRVVLRSLKRAFSKNETFIGCKENWWDLLKWDRPIRWAMYSFFERRKSFEKMAKDEKYNHAKIFRCQNVKMVNDCVEKLIS